MRYGSVCSGIEAATAAWHDLGWKPSFFSEIEAFPRAVLKHHYPDTPLHGDFTTIKGNDYDPIDLLVGGTPCQSFSIAGLRGGLADDRGNLALEFLRLADRTRPRWLVWENVPGVLSSNGGRDFGSILGGMGELGYGWAYRVLDAQYFGVAQRRRRVFVVGYLGDWRRAAAVLFERHSLQGHSPPRREKGQRIADSLTVGANQCSGRPRDFTEALNHWDGDQYPHPTLNQSNNAGGVGQSNQELFSQRGAYLTSDISHTLNAGGMGRQDYETETFVTMPTLTSNGDAHSGYRDEHGLIPITYSIMPQNSGKDYKAREVNVAQPIMAGGPVGGNQGGDYVVQPVAFHAEAQADQLPSVGRDTSISDSLTTSQHAAVAFGGDIARTLSARYDSSPCVDRGMDVVAFQSSQSGIREVTTHATLDANNGSRRHNGVSTMSGVRRLTPRECERLQGFPDDFSAIPWRGKPAAECPDGPRYKALGNSMAVPVMRWIGQRIQMVDNIS